MVRSHVRTLSLSARARV